MENAVLNRFHIPLLQLLAAAALAISAPFSMAHGAPDVRWSIGVGSSELAPGFYAPPAALYVQPTPVYIRPQPVRVQPAPVFVYGQSYYVPNEQSRGFRSRHRWHRHRRD